MNEANPLETAVIFCDGACSGNPGRGGWGAIVVRPDAQVEELGGGHPATTNNQMELTACIEALRAVADVKSGVTIYTDSVYVIRGITQWIWGWMRNGWKTAEGNEVQNKDLWQALSAIVGRRKKPHHVTWVHVRGHSGVPGNERCDEIAVSYTKGAGARLYRGPLLSYGVPVLDLPEDKGLPEMKPRQEKAKAHSYLSLLGGIPMRHATWAECERRVKGQPGAKFKKAASVEDETSILRSWGVDPSRLKS